MQPSHFSASAIIWKAPEIRRATEIDSYFDLLSLSVCNILFSLCRQSRQRHSSNCFASRSLVSRKRNKSLHWQIVILPDLHSKGLWQQGHIFTSCILKLVLLIAILTLQCATQQFLL